MKRHIHQDFENWLAEAVRGTLTPAERSEWEQHLATCPECMHRLEEPEILEQLLRHMSTRRGWDDGLEQRITAGFRDAFIPEQTRTQRLLKVLRRQRFRIAIAAVIGMLFVVRSLNVQFVTDAFAGGVELSAFWQGALRSPHYDGFLGQGNAVVDHDVFLATLHKLTSLYMEIFLFTLMLLALGLLILDLYRRRRILAAT